MLWGLLVGFFRFRSDISLWFGAMPRVLERLITLSLKSEYYLVYDYICEQAVRLS
jgi:hypothetical protein